VPCILRFGQPVDVSLDELRGDRPEGYDLTSFLLRPLARGLCFRIKAFGNQAEPLSGLQARLVERDATVEAEGTACRMLRAAEARDHDEGSMAGFGHAERQSGDQGIVVIDPPPHRLSAVRHDEPIR
jgi:hypothetical protein